MMALLMRDLKLAFRAGGGFGFAILFFFIVTLLLAFGIGPDVVLLGKIAPGALWSVLYWLVYCHWIGFSPWIMKTGRSTF